MLSSMLLCCFLRFFLRKCRFFYDNVSIWHYLEVILQRKTKNATIMQLEINFNTPTVGQFVSESANLLVWMSVLIGK